MNDKQYENERFQMRLWFALGIILLIFGVLISRLVYLQVIDHDHYMTVAEDNRHQLQPIAPTRGLIHDTKGRLLAGNRATHSVAIVPELLDGGMQGVDATIAQLQTIIAIDENDIKRFARRLRQARKPFSSIPLRYRLTEQEIAKITVNQHHLQGVRVEAELVRYYPFDNGFVHALGYVGRINDREIAYLDAVNYSDTHHVGKLGVEKFYENELHGKVGYQTVETNARGRILRVLDRVEPVPGQDITLHLDALLQQKAAQLLEGKRGAIVAIDPNTGGVLAMVSAPSYGANQFVTGISSKAYGELRNSDELPLFNRALRGRYPPASTVKPVIALAGIDTGLIRRDYSIQDPGYYQLSEGGRLYRDWKEGGHGEVDLHKSIVESVDTYYYDIGHQMGNEPMTRYLAKFGLGQITIADQPEALEAVLPTKTWKRAVRSTSWFPGDSLNLSIGQGFLSATPLQLATMTMVLANKGKWHQIRMIKSIDGTEVSAIEQINRSQPVIPEDVKLRHSSDWDRLHKAMEDVMHGGMGTARRSGADSAYRMAGKTGTAQVKGIKQDEEYDAEKVAERLRDHGLFVGWAPAENPAIVIAVVVENGGGGSSAAAPLARQLFDTYLLDQDDG
ncbi:MAG TPA: penicillin-binding protein 2 [Oceanospirillaceae bacterium]|nr:penicillin-binding protein 2 [Oceanospirillaceae bacterium]